MIYARTENGIVTDTLRVPPANIYPAAYASQFVEVPDTVGRGWLFDGTDYTAPPGPTAQELEKIATIAAKVELANFDLASIRGIREYLVAKADAPQVLKDIELAAIEARKKVK